MTRRALAFFVLALPAVAAIKFRPQEIQSNFGVVYAVLTADMNRDGKPDIVAINPTQAVWFENPTWTKHVMLDGGTKKDNVAIAVNDIDGDGYVDAAIGADWQPTNTQSGGSLQWIRQHPKNRNANWLLTPIGNEPTLHRMRWGDVDGDGKKELIVVPLHGRGTKAPDWEGQGARILVYWPQPNGKPWKMEVADDSLHIVHNLIAVDREVWTASKEGIHILSRTGEGKWTRRKIGEGAPGEIKLGQVNSVRHLATVEPWHGDKIVVYEEPTEMLNPQGGTKVDRPVIPNQNWVRFVIETGLTQAHALGWGDFDGDGSDELIAGWRNKPHGLALFQRVPNPSSVTPTVALPGPPGPQKWDKQPIDDGVAVEDLAVDDFNGDGKPDFVAVGRSTANVRIYWNESTPEWVRHKVASGYQTLTAVAADFTGDGVADIITNDSPGKKTYLYVGNKQKAGAYTQVVIDQGVSTIHSVTMDVDGDGDPDFIGCDYSPGHIYWLENPGKRGGKWPHHVIDDVKQGGVDGIHGLILGDIDRDGKLDLIGNSAQPAGPFAQSIAWFKIPKNPRLAWERHVFAKGDAPGLSHYMGVGDVNGDGRPDIAAGAKIAEGGNWFAWWEQPASGKEPWTKHVVATNQEGATNIHVADVNGDGKADLVASRGHGRGLVWFENPTWTPHAISDQIVGAHSLAIGDIDNDGDIDVATCAKDSLTAAWFENDGKGNFTTHHIHERQAAYDIKLVDIDKDGDLDVLIPGQESKNLVWFENRLKR
ncbi:MAG: VCBS repeat-containing protein [Bryobacterales bacterium]|nr:VCBS repeat-containing protein [Bryobacterales bacterium]